MESHRRDGAQAAILEHEAKDQTPKKAEQNEEVSVLLENDSHLSASTNLGHPLPERSLPVG